jgi:hypothetical protein
LHREQRDRRDFSYEFLASKQAKGHVFNFGVHVPLNVKEAHDLDWQNSNNNWQDAMQEDIDYFLAYSTFNDQGHIKILPGYKNIHAHFVFALKHELCHNGRVVSGGNLADPNTTDSQ